MRNKKFILTLSLFTLIFFASFSGFAHAWYNGPASVIRRRCADYAVKIGKDPVETYRQHYHQLNDPYQHFYGTHDYLAHFAIDYLCKTDLSGKYLWLEDLSRRYFYIYLLATEYPDYGKVAPKIVLDCGKSTQIKRDFSVNELHNLASCKSKVRSRALKINEALHKRNQDNELAPWFETVAFYIGVVTHYIAEVAHPHHASAIGTKWYHAWLEKEVSLVTTLEDYYDNGFFGQNFFTIDLENILYWSPMIDGFKLIEPGECVDKLALHAQLNKETFFNGIKEDGNQSAQYLYDFYANDCGSGNGAGSFEFADIGRDGSLLPPSLSYLANNFKAFFDRIEELLNWAVYYIACMIKCVLRNFNGQVTDCQDSNDDDGPVKPPDDTREPIEAVDFLIRYGAWAVALIAGEIFGKRYLAGKFR